MQRIASSCDASQFDHKKPAPKGRVFFRRGGSGFVPISVVSVHQWYGATSNQCYPCSSVV